ncbi:MAG: efflux RND transporter periplasmic adaptor subunit [Gemmatimonadaceae bacterium]|nr:efflux RND transporter periplasmic adaptor subunit [Chitinophagaceae bacterium]
MKITNNMKYTGLMAAIFFLAGCGGGEAKKGDKKAELEKLRTQQTALNSQIKSLEEAITKEDPSFGVKPKLVSITSVSTENFTHFIDLQGRISTENIYYVSPRGQGGQVKAVYVKEGDNVRKGQLLIRLDNAVMSQNVKQLETQLAYAKDLQKRQQNLWDQGIGTEVQLITAKNNVENLEKQMGILNEQLSTSNVYSEVSGVVETVNVHPGEIFTGMQGATISIVNPSNLKAVVDVPENYLSKVKKGAPVVVYIPDLGKEIKTNISLISQLISNTSRGFTAEAKVPSGSGLKPNQLATVKIQDYTASNTVVVPMTALQTDENGKYVFVAAKENNKLVARKKTVVAGEVYGEKIEIKSGLQVGDQFISEGFQSLYDGQLITTQL